MTVNKSVINAQLVRVINAELVRDSDTELVRNSDCVSDGVCKLVIGAEVVGFIVAELIWGHWC